jgi:hypothetical protein
MNWTTRQITQVIQSTASLVISRVRAKHDSLRSQSESLKRSSDPNRLIQLELVTVRSHVIDAKLNKLEHMRYRLECCADCSNSIEDFLIRMPEFVFSNEGLADDFDLSHWKLRKKSTLARYFPRELSEDVRRFSPSVRLQARVLFAFQNPTPLISDYVRHQFSPEGQQLRAFAAKMRTESDSHTLRQIPSVLEAHRDALLARIKQADQGGGRGGSRAHVSPADSLRHTREGSDALLAALADSKAKITTQQIDCEFEKYFFQIVGAHVFEVFAEPDADRVAAERFRRFANTTPAQFGMAVIFFSRQSNF